MHAVVIGLLAASILLCAIVYGRLRSQPALAWLAAGLACGGAETVFLAQPFPPLLATGSVSVLIPCAYLCLSQTIRALYGREGLGLRLFAEVAGLTAASLVLLAAGVGGLAQTLPFQVAGAIALADGIVCAARFGGRNMLDRALLAVLGLMAVVVVARMPVFPLLFDRAGMAVMLEQSTLQRSLLYAAMITVPGSVLLVISRIVVGVIAGHKSQSERDYLTDLPNRRTFEQAMSKPAVTSGAVIVCDIDNFKTINDRYGHAVGDDIIRVFASLLRGRQGLPARTGGEEFALVLPGVSAQDAHVLANAIRERFHALRHPLVAKEHKLSASFGVADFAAGDYVHRALVHADRALYRAKDAGRNRVVGSTETGQGGLALSLAAGSKTRPAALAAASR